jgi:aspartate racemase
MSSKPIIGLLGGMGPEATVDLMRRVIAATPAQDDADHIHMIVDNNPQVPSRIAALIDGTGVSPLPTLCTMAQRLKTAGATVLAMPCNTAHHYYDGVCSSVDLPFLNMIELTVQRVQSLFLAQRRVGLLASTAVLQIGLYHQQLAAAGLETVQPAQQNDLMAIIKAVKRGDTGQSVRHRFAQIASQLAATSDISIIACTELSVLADSLPADAPSLDALDVLVDEIVALGLGLKTYPTATTAIV